ncbi:MAG: tyrosine-type recombinase/integrase [Bdellovibrionales bacterium]|nr:tyrosine-type recombinase/integrase [Bdellovibrionales bacterium]
MGIRKVWGRLKIRVKTRIARVFGRKRTASKKPRKKLLVAPPAEEILPVVEPAWNTLPALPNVRALEAIEEFSGVQLSSHTQRAYKKDLQDYFSYLKTQDLWDRWSERVTPITISQYRQHLVKVRNLSKGSVTRKLAVLKSFYKWAQSRGWVRDNPAELVRSFPQTQESKTGFLNDAEIDTFLDYFAEDQEPRLMQALSQTVVETLLMLGLRRSEAARITAGDLEYVDERWGVRIRGKGDRDRTLPLPPRLVHTWSVWWRRLSEEAPAADLDAQPAAWADWCRRNAAQPLLVSSRAKTPDVAISSSEIARIVRKSARKAGIVNRVSPHMLRATAITHALDQGATHRGVQQMAGWTSPLMITRYDKRRKDPRYSAVFHLKYARLGKGDREMTPPPLAATREADLHL